MLLNTRENSTINGLISIFYYIVTDQALRRKVSSGQCFKCQQYFHNSRFCQRVGSLLEPKSREIAPSPVRTLRSLQTPMATTQQTMRVVLKNHPTQKISRRRRISNNCIRRRSQSSTPEPSEKLQDWSPDLSY
ncbi:hypothetical protein AVEN_121611-1 [Araneus ventricosus]|uniref:Uncharacterized protein n=1 Tax=Araneus ventricosus TaxID=182803 RepID=A0A4Y2DTW7_ARAVE|nr:hypothetical protein AVEN_121611-1 [Araneus ventricosus]